MNSPLPVRWHAFALPKRGHTLDEYEDAHAGNPATGRFAVADGATESSFAGKWAKLLVEGYVRIEEGRTATNWLKPLRQRWAEDVASVPLAWYGEEKRDDGAFATFVGLALKQPDAERVGRWKALAIGDSCLFHVRKDRLLTAFPLTSADAFTQQPSLLDSRPRLKDAVVPVGCFERGKWQADDRFFLMTDALAQWFLRRHAQGLAPWQSLARRLAEPKADVALGTYCEELRDRKELRNDDVTLVAICL
ncbi:MAG: protein phosphatase 2C domain-containing protein [Gemmataceae bacterium]|nr:protein phosphatase 2C domain-containing protein [Gemmataceae bacterium]